jgi:hypothetical protein
MVIDASSILPTTVFSMGRPVLFTISMLPFAPV